MSKITKTSSTTTKPYSARSKRLGTGGKDVTISEVPGMLYIYTRVSTSKQTGDNQSQALMELHKASNPILVEEVAGGTKARPKLVELIERLTKLDTIIVYSLDRLGRSTHDVLGLIQQIIDKGAKLILHREQVSYYSASGRALIQIMAAVAELERNLISERTKTALAARKAKGVKLGRPRVIPEATKAKALRLLNEGKSLSVVAAYCRVSRSQVAKWKAELEESEDK